MILYALLNKKLKKNKNMTEHQARDASEILERLDSLRRYRDWITEKKNSINRL